MVPLHEIKNRCLFWLVVALLIRRTTSQETVYETLFGNPNFSLFRDVLRLSGMNIRSVLADTSQVVTLFAPTNKVLTKDAAVLVYLEQPGWGLHLKEISDLHLFVGDSMVNQTLGGGSVLQSIFATNGVLNVIDGVLQNEWKGVPLRNRVAARGSSNMSSLVIEADFGKELDGFVPSGTTFVATSDDFFEKPENGIFLKNLLNQTSNGKTYTNLLYNTIDVNLYSQNLKPGINYLATPRGGMAQMWVTKDSVGTVRFNDAIATGFEMAENGVFYVVDRLLSPPSMLQFLGITAAHSDLQVTNAYNLFSAIFWDKVELGRLFGYKEGTKFTLFAPTDDVSGALPLEETVRLLNPIWSRHLEDLLKHWLTDRAYTRQQLRQMAVSSGGEFELLMLSGSTVLIVAEGDDDLSVSDGSSIGNFLKPSDLGGVDGILQVVDAVLLPPSMQYGVLELVNLDPDLSTLASILGMSKVFDVAADIAPFTFLAPGEQNLAAYKILPMETTTFIQSHLFKGLLFASELLEMDGETITSVNGMLFLVAVEDNAVTIRSPDGQHTAVVVAKDILGNTGVMHRISHPLTDIFQVSTTNAPTSASTQQFLTDQVTVEDETVAPSQPETQDDTMTLSGSLFPTKSFAPTDELETNVPLTDFPTMAYVLDSMQPTVVDGEASEHEVQLSMAGSSQATAPTDQLKSPRTAAPTTNQFKSTRTAAPTTKSSVAPTQLIEVVVSKGSDNTKGDLSWAKNISFGENQVSSATSGAHQVQHTTILFGAAMSLLLL